MGKFIIKVLLFSFFTVLSLVICVFAIIKCVPPQFGDLFQAEITNKIERLNNVNGRKIVYVSGSSGVFCVDSKKISKELGLEFVNMGLHAGLGQYYINEISKEGLKKGDILIIAHEFDTYYYDGNAYGGIALLATSINDHLEYYKYFTNYDKKRFIAYLPAYIFTKLDKLIYKKSDADGIYSASAFNKYGDIKYELNESLEHDYYHHFENYTKEFPKSIIEYYHDLLKFAKKKGVYVVLNFPYMRVKTKEVDYKYVDELGDAIQKELGIKSLYPLKEAIKEEKYFYDTANHCNTFGKNEYNNKLIKSLKKYMKENNI